MIMRSSIYLLFSLYFSESVSRSDKKIFLNVFIFKWATCFILFQSFFFVLVFVYQDYMRGTMYCSRMFWCTVVSRQDDGWENTGFRGSWFHSSIHPHLTIYLSIYDMMIHNPIVYVNNPLLIKGPKKPYKIDYTLQRKYFFTVKSINPSSWFNPSLSLVE